MHTCIHIVYVHAYVCTYVYIARTCRHKLGTHTHTYTYTEQTQYFLKYYMHKCLFLCSVLYVCVTRRVCVLDSVSRLILSLKLVDCRRRCPRRGILLLLPVANYGPAQCGESSPIWLFLSLFVQAATTIAHEYILMNNLFKQNVRNLLGICTSTTSAGNVSLNVRSPKKFIDTSAQSIGVHAFRLQLCLYLA